MGRWRCGHHAIGNLVKKQVVELAQYLGIPKEILIKLLRLVYGKVRQTKAKWG